jgi:hypothetical protein
VVGHQLEIFESATLLEPIHIRKAPDRLVLTVLERSGIFEGP